MTGANIWRSISSQSLRYPSLLLPITTEQHLVTCWVAITMRGLANFGTQLLADCLHVDCVATKIEKHRHQTKRKNRPWIGMQSPRSRAWSAKLCNHPRNIASTLSANFTKRDLRNTFATYVIFMMTVLVPSFTALTAIPVEWGKDLALIFVIACGVMLACHWQTRTIAVFHKSCRDRALFVTIHCSTPLNPLRVFDAVTSCIFLATRNTAVVKTTHVLCAWDVWKTWVTTFRSWIKPSACNPCLPHSKIPLLILIAKTVRKRDNAVIILLAKSVPTADPTTLVKWVGMSCHLGVKCSRWRAQNSSPFTDVLCYAILLYD